MLSDKGGNRALTPASDVFLATSRDSCEHLLAAQPEKAEDRREGVLPADREQREPGDDRLELCSHQTLLFFTCVLPEGILVGKKKPVSITTGRSVLYSEDIVGPLHHFRDVSVAMLLGGNHKR